MFGSFFAHTWNHCLYSACQNVAPNCVRKHGCAAVCAWEDTTVI